MYLRPMNMDDASFMLELKNYPETRQFAIQSHDEIKLEDHLKWLEKNIQFFQVIVNDYKNPVGAIRIQDKEVSIWIHQAYRNRMYASLTLKENTGAGMIAKIVNGNVGSFRAFVRAGFKPVDYKENYYILQR